MLIQLTSSFFKLPKLIKLIKLIQLPKLIKHIKLSKSPFHATSIISTTSYQPITL